MQFLKTFFVLLGLLLSQTVADLTCLKWDLLFKPIGLICHFKPEVYTKLADTVDAAINSTYTAVEDLIHFDLTHNPATVSYNYVQNTIAGGLPLANAGLANITHDFTQVSIGFGKDAINAGVQIYNLIDWSDVTLCMLNDTSTTYLEAVLPVTNEAAFKRYIECTKTKLSKPLAYNITGDIPFYSRISRAEIDL